MQNKSLNKKMPFQQGVVVTLHLPIEGRPKGGGREMARPGLKVVSSCAMSAREQSVGVTGAFKLDDLAFTRP